MAFQRLFDQDEESIFLPSQAIFLPKQHGGIQWQGRDYTLNPVTSQESKYITQQKEQLAHGSNITAAVCHRPLFGNVTLNRMFPFVSYYRLMGFDHVFLWYQPHVAGTPRFEELAALPYVTMTEYAGDAPEFGQHVAEQACMGQPEFAANYTWALPIDVDEYLWLDKPESIQSFLARKANDLHYISIGKRMYTHQYSVEATTPDSGFGLDRFSYTAGDYCYQNPIKRTCPTWKGRSKVLVRPSKHPRGVRIHGYASWAIRPGGTHMNPDIMHLKEWPSMMRTEQDNTTTLMPNRDTIHVRNQSQVKTHHTMEGQRKQRDGTVAFKVDERLQYWFRFVAQGAPLSTTTTAAVTIAAQ
jgi:hypothetical protein